MVFKVGDRVEITADIKGLQGAFGEIKGIDLELGIIFVDKIELNGKRVSKIVFDGRQLLTEGGLWLFTSQLKVVNPQPQFSIDDWDSIMEAIAHG